jgi:hypothetical protein
MVTYEANPNIWVDIEIEEIEAGNNLTIVFWVLGHDRNDDDEIVYEKKNKVVVGYSESVEWAAGLIAKKALNFSKYWN